MMSISCAFSMLLRTWDYINALYAFANKIFKFEKKNEDWRDLHDKWTDVEKLIRGLLDFSINAK